jgi:hypothetical protein
MKDLRFKIYNQNSQEFCDNINNVLNMVTGDIQYTDKTRYIN